MSKRDLHFHFGHFISVSYLDGTASPSIWPIRQKPSAEQKQSKYFTCLLSWPHCCSDMHHVSIPYIDLAQIAIENVTFHTPTLGSPWIFSHFVYLSVPMMKITDLSHLSKQENLRNRWLTKYYHSWPAIVYKIRCRSIQNVAAFVASVFFLFVCFF